MVFVGGGFSKVDAFSYSRKYSNWVRIPIAPSKQKLFSRFDSRGFVLIQEPMSFSYHKELYTYDTCTRDFNQRPLFHVPPAANFTRAAYSSIGEIAVPISKVDKSSVYINEVFSVKEKWGCLLNIAAEILSCEFSSDGTFLAVILSEGVLVYERDNVLSPRSFFYKTGEPCIAFSEDNKKIAVATSNNQVLIFSIFEDIPPVKLQLSGLPYKIKFSPNGNILAVAYRDADTNRIFIWNMNLVDEGSVFSVSKERDNMVTQIVFSLNNHLLVTGDSSGVIKFWDPIERILLDVDDRKAKIDDLRFINIGNLLALTCDDFDGTVLWEYDVNTIAGYGSTGAAALYF